MESSYAIIAAVLACSMLITPTAQAAPTGNDKVIIESSPIPKTVYTGSYALLISQRGYQNPHDWPLLDISSMYDADALGGVLRGQGFLVDREDNLRGVDLDSRIQKFIDTYANPQSRPLIYFSGHGATDPTHLEGFLVGVDAGAEPVGSTTFRQHALSTDRILQFANDQRARHILFIFDACFSAAAFRTREGIHQINSMRVLDIMQVARQFISSTDEFQPSPDISVFTPALIRGISGAADLNHDGIVLASELSEYLKDNVTSARTPTAPQYGDVLSRGGDFLFKYAAVAGPLKPPAPLASTQPSVFDNVNVIYFRKAADKNTILATLREANISFTSTKSPNPETLESDGIACTADTPIEAVKALARLMSAAGHDIKAVIPVTIRKQPRTIEIVSFNEEGHEWQTPILDEDDINTLTGCDQEVVGGPKG